MNYVLLKATELAEILPLRCSYGTEHEAQLAIQSIGLGSTDTQHTQFVNYDQSCVSPDLETVISKFIKDIDFASLHMILNHSKLKTLINAEMLLEKYQIPLTKPVLKTIERAISWSDNVLIWLVKKNVKPQEIPFLVLLCADECKQLLESAVSCQLPKLESLKILETASELMLLKIDIKEFLHTTWTESTLAKINAVRYPINFFSP